MHELKWSHAEKTVARRAFDKALGKELEALIREAKSRAGRIEEPPDLWNLENWLTERRRENSHEQLSLQRNSCVLHFAATRI
jgi:hypothetical protein